MKVAIGHDYLTQRGGAERVVLSLLKAFPDATLHTTLYRPESTYEEFSGFDVRTSPLNRFEVFRRNHRAALPFLPWAARRVKIDADVFIASTSGWSHGFDAPGALKIAYCYSPARWLYEGDRYLGEDSGNHRRLALRAVSPALRRWDAKAAAGIDQYLAISRIVRDRIKDTYGRDSLVLPAPHSFAEEHVQENVPLPFPAGTPYLLCVSRLLPYKNVGPVVEGAKRAGLPLVVVGAGPERERLVAQARGQSVFLSHLSDAQMRWLYAHSIGTVSASYEDFGLMPLEAGVFGRPSAVLRYGGFLDTVVEGTTGVFFDQPTPHDIASALQRLQQSDWDHLNIAAHAASFAEPVFIARIREIVEALNVERGGAKD